MFATHVRKNLPGELAQQALRYLFGLLRDDTNPKQQQYAATAATVPTDLGVLYASRHAGALPPKAVQQSSFLFCNLFIHLGEPLSVSANDLLNVVNSQIQQGPPVWIPKDQENPDSWRGILNRTKTHLEQGTP